VFQRPLVMPMVNMMKNEYRPHFSTITPWLGQIFGHHCGGNAACRRSRRPHPDPDVMMVACRVEHVEAFARLPKPCHLSEGFSPQSSPGTDAFRRPECPAPYLEPTSPVQTLRHLAHRAAESSAQRWTLHQRGAAGGSIIAAATSHDAIIAYCGWSTCASDTLR